MVAASYKDANGHAIASRHRAEYVALRRETMMSFQTSGDDHGDATRSTRARLRLLCHGLLPSMPKHSPWDQGFGDEEVEEVGEEDGGWEDDD